MFGDDEGEERPGMKTRKKVKVTFPLVFVVVVYLFGFFFCWKPPFILIFSSFLALYSGLTFIIKTLFLICKILPAKML